MDSPKGNSRAEDLVMVINAIFPPSIILVATIAALFMLPPERREIILSGTIGASAAAWTIKSRSAGATKQNISLDAELNAGDNRGSGRFTPSDDLSDRPW